MGLKSYTGFINGFIVIPLMLLGGLTLLGFSSFSWVNFFGCLLITTSTVIPIVFAMAKLMKMQMEKAGMLVTLFIKAIGDGLKNDIKK